MNLSKILVYSCAAVFSAGLAAPSAVAGPDPDPEGAVRALWSIPLDSAGDAVGAVGLIGASVVGAVGDLVALVDHNEFSHPFLRGIASTGIRRTALGISRLGTGTLEGLHNVQFSHFPEPEATYLRPDGGSGHLGTFGHGLGAIGLTIVDAFANTGLFFTHASGATDASDALIRGKSDVRVAWVGPGTDGEGEMGIVNLAKSGD